eukprot:s172_g14.t1
MDFCSQRDSSAPLVSSSWMLRLVCSVSLFQRLWAASLRVLARVLRAGSVRGKRRRSGGSCTDRLRCSHLINMSYRAGKWTWVGGCDWLGVFEWVFQVFPSPESRVLPAECSEIAEEKGPGKAGGRGGICHCAAGILSAAPALWKAGGEQPGGACPGNPFAAMFGGAGAGQPPKKTSDTWFLNKLPVLKRIKRPVLIAFFAFCFYRGWVGRWGFVFGCMAGSYFDMLAVPLRVSDRSPFTGRAYVMTQIYVDYFFKLIGYIINVAKGKAKFPPDFSKMLTPPAAGAGAGTNPFAPGANPFAAAGGKPGENPFAWRLKAVTGANDMTNPFDVSPVEQYQSPPVQPTDMPTAPTVGSPPPARKVTQEASTTPMAPLTVEQVPSEKKSPPARSRPPVVDADVTFLD